ncbi:glycosyltransferase family 2 protein [Cryptosporangium phraense]|uniref:Glycosyltransferase family 2 protein n=1 Tax=Cryptosporangium phraense TaxID=2593070 RepID=A0A545AG58_9ACTN|nr:glycosyltransferase family 2 protein [Cryptosporangium phraense]TQS40323.1 glycosyltransferase family 2 protein [Cryptosporangium phraense]
MKRTVSVVVPAMNDARTIPTVLAALPTSVTEVLLIDAGPVDAPGTRVIRPTRQGRGNALAAGLEAATGDYIVVLDADGSTDPNEIGAFLQALDNGADYVKGRRGVSAFRRTVIPAFGLPPAHVGGARWGDGPEVATLMNIRVGRADLVVVEVLTGESNRPTLRDGWRVLVTVVRERFGPKDARPAADVEAVTPHLRTSARA